MFDTARDIWFPCSHWSLASTAEECTASGKILKPLCRRNDLGTVFEPKEPNEFIQLDFWGPVKNLKESDKYVLVLVDLFSRWPSAMICNNNKSDKVLKFIFKHTSNQGVPRKIYMDQCFCYFFQRQLRTFVSRNANLFFFSGQQP